MRWRGRTRYLEGGHKSRSVFDRFHIVNPGDLQEAMRGFTDTKRAPSRSGS